MCDSVFKQTATHPMKWDVASDKMLLWCHNAKCNAALGTHSLYKHHVLEYGKDILKLLRMINFSCNSEARTNYLKMNIMLCMAVGIS